MNNFQIDPYAILQINRNAKIEDIRRAYRALALIYHPDKPTGNAEMFRILTEAYQSILARHGIDQNQGVREDLEVVRRTSFQPQDFTNDRFNQDFQSNRNAGGQDYIYGIDDTSYQPRNLADYRRQRESIEFAKPLFNRGMGFNQNVFNQMFEKLKKKNEEQQSSLVQYEGPQPMVSQNQIAFSNVNPHSGDVTQHHLSTGDLQSNYARLNDHNLNEFSNPKSNEMNRRLYERMRDRPDITKVNKMSRTDVKRRMNNYQKNSKYVIPKGGKPPTGDLDYDFDGQYQYGEKGQIHPSFARNVGLGQSGGLLLTEAQHSNSNQSRTARVMPPTQQPQLSIQYHHNQNSNQQSTSTGGLKYRPSGGINADVMLFPPPNYNNNTTTTTTYQPGLAQPMNPPPQVYPQQQIRDAQPVDPPVPNDYDNLDKISQLEKELANMRRRVKIQDKLIKKINNGMNK